nr:immunoglobulin light chain junction region [Macaca mulatta]MOX55129.1 immunoglobulin light chain junction region [Macaca mulatta]MOX55163.1 immunoglobulin light chain junction region [Macaca mulatta]MOX55499.1 immunoglobulin light chain junction region [Macaca mulatta]
CMQCRYIPPTI